MRVYIHDCMCTHSPPPLLPFCNESHARQNNMPTLMPTLESTLMPTLKSTLLSTLRSTLVPIRRGHPYLQRSPLYEQALEFVQVTRENRFIHPCLQGGGFGRGNPHGRDVRARRARGRKFPGRRGQSTVVGRFYDQAKEASTIRKTVEKRQKSAREASKRTEGKELPCAVWCTGHTCMKKLSHRQGIAMMVYFPFHFPHFKGI